MTLCLPGQAPWGIPESGADGKRYRREPAYKAAKQRLITALLDASELAIGPFRDHIVHLEAATPLTNERYTMSTGGTPYGMAKWGTAGQWPDTATSVLGLNIVGPNTRYGSGIAGVALSGITAAGQCIGRPRLREVYAVGQVADPANLPPRPDGWDPLLISRGTARRHARGLARLGR
ncbi:MAG TPA: hypothetical protein VN969_33290 [Streptosporangiaceae bacterium]|jgi:all-trans-retinol 13,14-reductase|nr:hypothetical protein [Streptosporangiaceae bacterium]